MTALISRLQRNRIRAIRIILICCVSHFCVNASTVLLAADDINLRTKTGAEIFEKVIRPTLIEHCEKCHGDKKQQGGLRLDSREGWMTGGDSGSAITQGDDQSLLLKVIRYEPGEMEMPPRGKLPKATIDAFHQWIQLGAPDPRTNKPTDNDEPNHKPVDQSFWSFQTSSAKVPPNSEASNRWSANEIDRFIFARLQANNLRPSPNADRPTLIRRLSYDLRGLPPTIDEIQAFELDHSANAYEKIVDRYLESSSFGERWGRHWLDVVRFAESSGGGRTLLFPDAWRYRDYVIESFNRDLPFNQFIIEQIAGDLLDCDDHLERQRQLIATGLLLLGPTNYEMQDKDILEMDVVDEQIDTIGKAFMGMTIGCARCHDHKFDPIPTNDYYALAGIFKSTHSLTHSNVSTWNTVNLPLESSLEKEIQANGLAIAELREQLKLTKNDLQKIEGKPANLRSIKLDSIQGIVLDDKDATKIGHWKKSTSIPIFVGPNYIHDENQELGKKSVTFKCSEKVIGRFNVFISYTSDINRSTAVPVTVRHSEGEETIWVNQRKKGPIYNSFLSLGTFSFDEAHPPEVTIANEPEQDGVVIADAIILADHKMKNEEIFTIFAPVPTPEKEVKTETLRQSIASLEKEIRHLQSTTPKRPVAMSVTDSKNPSDIHLAIRGVTSQKGALVKRGVLTAANPESFSEIKQGASGRREFAEWIASPDHPLTARVMANRIWYWMMGQGIVQSLDNFGSTGSRPTHPELLDFLAATLIKNNWSVKRLAKMVAMSNTYQQSSDALQNPNSNLGRSLYSHRRPKRLRAEDIRDSLLTLGQSLDSSVGGPSIKPGTKIEYDYKFDSSRRSVYLPVFRNTLPEIFEVFDFADPNIQQGHRNESTVASQALWLMNHPLMLSQTELAAEKLLSIQLNTDQDRLRVAYLQTLGRQPSEAETAVVLDFLRQEMNDPRSTGDASDSIRSWTMLYQMLCQSVDFLYLN